MPEGDKINKISCHNYKYEMEVALELLGGKWVAIIMRNLGIQKTIRFTEFTKIIPDISQKMLTQQLKKLEKNLLISRYVHNTVPPIVEYSLTDLGKSALPVLNSLNDWGKIYLENFLKSKN